MIIKNNTMRKEVREKMRGGDGNIEILHLVEQEKLSNSRLLARIVIPVKGSIGDHQHSKETEYYIILEGKGIVVDDGEEKEVNEGDVVITGSGATHSVINTGDKNLEMIAIIILD